MSSNLLVTTCIGQNELDLYLEVLFLIVADFQVAKNYISTRRQNSTTKSTAIIHPKNAHFKIFYVREFSLHKNIAYLYNKIIVIHTFNGSQNNTKVISKTKRQDKPRSLPLQFLRWPLRRCVQTWEISRVIEYKSGFNQLFAIVQKNIHRMRANKSKKYELVNFSPARYWYFCAKFRMSYF